MTIIGDLYRKNKKIFIIVMIVLIIVTVGLILIVILIIVLISRAKKTKTEEKTKTVGGITSTMTKRGGLKIEGKGKKFKFSRRAHKELAYIENRLKNERFELNKKGVNKEELKKYKDMEKKLYEKFAEKRIKNKEQGDDFVNLLAVKQTDPA